MLGWWISLYAIEPKRYAKADAAVHRDTMLASWEVDPSGTLWLDILIEQGKVEQRRDGGYPSEYTGLAADILPLLAHGMPDHRTLSDKYPYAARLKSELTLHADRIAACAPSQPLTIVVWDLS